MKSAGCYIYIYICACRTYSLPNEANENPGRYHTACAPNQASPQSPEFYLVDHTPPRLCGASKACAISSVYLYNTLATAHPLGRIISSLICSKTGRVKNAERCLYWYLSMEKISTRSFRNVYIFGCVRPPSFGEARPVNSPRGCALS